MSSPLDVPTSGEAGFSLLTPEQTRVTFTNALDSWASASNRVLNNGSGVAAGDFDNDGRADLFFCSLDQRNRLFKNLGNWQFKDVTVEAGLRFPPFSIAPPCLPMSMATVGWTCWWAAYPKGCSVF
jgi:hypothetical protein